MSSTLFSSKRMLNAAIGGEDAKGGAALMISKKTQAAMRYGAAFMAGGSLDPMIDGSRGVVQANASRLAQL